MNGFYCAIQKKFPTTSFYGPQSLIFPEAENRMWTVMSVVAAQLGKV
jgi:ornithine carbamoyltransferase